MNIKQIMKSIITGIKLYLFWTFLHWSSVSLYHRLCVREDLIGFIITPLMTQAPHCKVLIWSFKHSADAFNGFNTIIISWMVGIIHTNFSVKHSGNRLGSN